MTKPLSSERLNWLVERNQVLELTRRKATLAVKQAAQPQGMSNAARILAGAVLQNIDAEISQNQMEISVLVEYGVAP
jgi:hypothetical protein